MTTTTLTPTQTAILAAYDALSTKPQDWVHLAALRPLVRVDQATVDRAAVDAELLTLTRTGLVHLAPNSDRKNLGDDDHAAALNGAHLLAVDDDLWT